jgi:hypothetical protein
MIHLNGLLMGHSKMGILFQKGAQILQLHIYRIFIFKSILMQFFFYKLIVLVASRRMSTDFLYLYLAVSEINSIKRGQTKAKFQNLNFLIFHGNLMQFFFLTKWSSYYVLLMNHKKNCCYFIFENGSERVPNSAILHI